MGLKRANRGFGSVAAAGAVLLALAGCQSGDTQGALNVGPESEKLAEPKVRQSDLSAYCPQVVLREGTAIYKKYEGETPEGDAAKLVYQASITDVSRECSRANGMLTMNVGIAGRVVPGPLSKAGNLQMPIRVVAVRGDDVLYSKLHQHPVAVGEGSAAVQFAFNDAAVTFPIPEGRNIQVFAGYDEGPPPKN